MTVRLESDLQWCVYRIEWQHLTCLRCGGVEALPLPEGRWTNIEFGGRCLAFERRHANCKENCHRDEGAPADAQEGAGKRPTSSVGVGSADPPRETARDAKTEVPQAQQRSPDAGPTDPPGTRRIVPTERVEELVAEFAGIVSASNLRTVRDTEVCLRELRVARSLLHEAIDPGRTWVYDECAWWRERVAALLGPNPVIGGVEALVRRAAGQKTPPTEGGAT